MEEQIQRLKKTHHFDEKKLCKSLEEFMQDISKFVFEDFIQFANLHKKDVLIVLSFGNKVFQKNKIESSKIRNYISDVVITDKSKMEALANMLKEKNLPKEKIFFLDDRTEQIRGVKNRFPDVVTIFIKRQEGRYQDIMENQYCNFEAHNLKEAQEIIEKLSLI